MDDVGDLLSDPWWTPRRRGEESRSVLTQNITTRQSSIEKRSIIMPDVRKRGPLPVLLFQASWSSVPWVHVVDWCTPPSSLMQIWQISGDPPGVDPLSVDPLGADPLSVDHRSVDHLSVDPR